MTSAALKICGLMRAQDVIACCRLNIDILGFVTEYPTSVPWDLTRDQTARLMENVSGTAKTCIVTGGSREKILSLARKLKPDYIQLQGHETLVDAALVAKTLLPEGIRVIKVIPEHPMERMIQFATSDPARCARLLNDTQVSMVMAGCHFSMENMGRHRIPELDFFRQLQESSKLPVILAGGVTPDNCQSILKSHSPAILDVMTSVEVRPGVKDADLIKKLVKAAE